MSVNKVIILGRLGQDPELKHTPSGAVVCNLSLATTEAWNDKKTGQKQEKTEWHRVVMFGKIAELSNQYLKKGSQAFVEGKLQTRSWEDKDGNKRYTTEIVANSVQFIGAKNESSSEQKPAEDYKPSEDADFAADNIPF